MNFYTLLRTINPRWLKPFLFVRFKGSAIGESSCLLNEGSMIGVSWHKSEEIPSSVLLV